MSTLSIEFGAPVEWRCRGRNDKRDRLDTPERDRVRFHCRDHLLDPRGVHPVTPPMILDLFARRPQFIDHLAPIWFALSSDERGVCYISQDVETRDLGEYARVLGIDPVVCLENRESPDGRFPILVAAYDDLVQATWNGPPGREYILMEHGVGLTPGGGSPGYAGGRGLRETVSLTLTPNQYISRRTRRAIPSAKIITIGTPKLDPWAGYVPPPLPQIPTICISFHWDGTHVTPEAGNALRHYLPILPSLGGMSKYRVIGHGHPKIADNLRPMFEEFGIPFFDRFDDVMHEADVYVNDCSSTVYEFLVTGKPVILLNAPWFRRDVVHGIRFWDYTDIGISVDRPEDLLDAIDETCRSPQVHRDSRDRAVRDLYPFLGVSAGRAAGAIQGFFEQR